MSTETSKKDLLHRSAMYTPGTNTRALAKGRGVPADILIMDLEDGVAHDVKDTARENVIQAIGEGGYGWRQIGVRVNGLDSQWHQQDVISVAASKANILVLPKVDSVEAVLSVVRLMEKVNAPTAMQIWCMIETAHGVINVNEIAKSHSRVSGLLIGSADLTKDLRAQHTPDRLALLTSIQLCILAARANNLIILDSPFFDLSDDEGFLESCRQGRSMGFDGKTLLHPKTVPSANAIFGPTDEEISWAHKITAAHKVALADGRGVTLVDGQLVEGLHVEEAQRLVKLAETIKKLESRPVE